MPISTQPSSEETIDRLVRRVAELESELGQTRLALAEHKRVVRDLRAALHVEITDDDLGLEIG